MDKLLTRDDAYQKTLEAIKMEHDQSITFINDMIKSAATDMKNEVIITEEDMIPLSTQVGIRLKKFFISLGYDVKFLANTNEGSKLIISWDNKC